MTNLDQKMTKNDKQLTNYDQKMTKKLPKNYQKCTKNVQKITTTEYFYVSYALKIFTKPFKIPISQRKIMTQWTQFFWTK